MNPGETLTSIDLARAEPFGLAGAQVRPPTRELICGERREMVEPRVMQVLVALARRRGEVVSRDELIQLCWGGRIVGEDAINRAIAGVRRLASDFGGFSIETVARVGYRLTEAAPHRGGIWGKPRAGLWMWAVAAAMVLAAASGAWLLRGRIASAPKPEERVAVLPFDAPAGDARARDFAVGLTDEILAVISANRQQAISRTEADALRGAERDQAVRRLGVGLMLDGAVQSEGGRLRVRAHLDDAHDHVTLWSRDFEGPADRPASLQAQVAAVTTDTVDWALIARRSVRTRLDATTMIAFLHATDLLTSPGTQAKLEAAVADLRQVTRRAPDFALGHANLALALSGIGDPLVWKDEGLREANRAIALDPRTAAAYLALADLTPRQHWREREALLTKAVEADSGFSFARLFESRFLTEVGRLADALPQAERAVALRPLFPGGNSTLGHLLVMRGQVDEGRKVLDNAAARWPDNDRTKIERLSAALEVDDMDAALALLADPDTRPFTVSAVQVTTWRAALQARKSRDPNAMRMAAVRVRQEPDPSAIWALNAAILCALSGNLDCAFAEADRWAPSLVGADIGVLYAPTTRSMRRDPRFMALAARLGLVDYWRSTGHWPDFCAEPGLPYDCKVEAAKVPVRPS
jgi:TolB-like protein